MKRISLVGSSSVKHADSVNLPQGEENLSGNLKEKEIDGDEIYISNVIVVNALNGWSLTVTDDIGEEFIQVFKFEEKKEMKQALLRALGLD